VRDIVHTLVTRELTKVEPMPEWGTVNLPKLEAALAAPRQAGFGVEFYPELADKTAILLYGIAKGHAWANGNKRMAFISTLVFLGLNDRWWDFEGGEARDLLVWVASSEARLSKEALAYLNGYFRRRIVIVTTPVS
jgi:death-on-curing protein